MSVHMPYTSIVLKWLNVSSNFFIIGSHAILVLTHETLWQYHDSDPLMGESNAGEVWKHCDFLPISH